MSSKFSTPVRIVTFILFAVVLGYLLSPHICATYGHYKNKKAEKLEEKRFNLYREMGERTGKDREKAWRQSRKLEDKIQKSYESSVRALELARHIRPSTFDDEDLIVLANSRIRALGRSSPHRHTFSHIRETLALAKAELEEAIHKNEENKDAYTFLIQANLHQLGPDPPNPEGAVEVCKRFEKAFPGDADMHYNCAYAYIVSQDTESARPHLERAIELDNTGNSHMLYSVFLLMDDKADEGIKLLEKFVEDNPTSPGVWDVKTQLDMMEEDRKQSEKAEKLFAQDPDDFETVRELAEALSQSGQHDLAYEWHQKAYDMRPNDEWALRRLAGLKMSRDPEGAVKLYKKLLGTSNDKVYTMQLIGQAYFRGDNYEEALSWYKKAEANHEPTRSMLLFRIAECYDKMGNDELAEEYSQKFVRQRKYEEKHTRYYSGQIGPDHEH